VFSGADGLDALRVVADVAARLLRAGGLLAVEHAEAQHSDVLALYARHGGYDTVRDHRDLTDRWRFVTARRIL
jgi:release factor glutamine methyltransferase